MTCRGSNTSLAVALGGWKLSPSSRWSSDPLVQIASMPFNTVQDVCLPWRTTTRRWKCRFSDWPYMFVVLFALISHYFLRCSPCFLIEVRQQRSAFHWIFRRGISIPRLTRVTGPPSLVGTLHYQLPAHCPVLRGPVISEAAALCATWRSASWRRYGSLVLNR